jgi:rfaE bifunctional protein nucleotidyltransferase chain/domain
LIIGLNSDSSVKRLGKGDERPYNSEENRAYLLAAFGFIDAVVVFEEDTPIELIKIIKPDVLVKGGDYDASAVKSDKKYIVGSDILKAYSGTVEVIPFLKGFSTTSLVEKIKKSK